MSNHEEREKQKPTSLGEHAGSETLNTYTPEGESLTQREPLTQKPVQPTTQIEPIPSNAPTAPPRVLASNPPTGSLPPSFSAPAQQPHERKSRARGTAAMDPQTRREVARKGGLAVSRNKQHMAEIGRKGGQSVSKNREHMAKIGRKGGAAARGQRSTS